MNSGTGEQVYGVPLQAAVDARANVVCPASRDHPVHTRMVQWLRAWYARTDRRVGASPPTMSALPEGPIGVRYSTAERRQKRRSAAAAAVGRLSIVSAATDPRPRSRADRPAWPADSRVFASLRGYCAGLRHRYARQRERHRSLLRGTGVVEDVASKATSTRSTGKYYTAALGCRVCQSCCPSDTRSNRAGISDNRAGMSRLPARTPPASAVRAHQGGPPPPLSARRSSGSARAAGRGSPRRATTRPRPRACPSPPPAGPAPRRISRRASAERPVWRYTAARLSISSGRSGAARSAALIWRSAIGKVASGDRLEAGPFGGEGGGRRGEAKCENSNHAHRSSPQLPFTSPVPSAEGFSFVTRVCHF